MSEETAAPAQILSLAEARSRLLRTRQPATKVVEFEGAKFLIVAPTVGQRSDIINSSFSEGQQKMQGELYRVGALIACLHVINPDGQPGARVFGETDLEVLMAEPADGQGVVDVLGNAVVAFINEITAKRATVPNVSSATPA